MADDWDLYAVVRSCTTTVSTASSRITTGATATIGDPDPSPNSNLPSPQSDDHNQFQFPSGLRIDDKDESSSFQGLDEIYKELHSEIFDRRHIPAAAVSQQHSPKPPNPFQQQPHQIIPPQQKQNLQLIRNAVLAGGSSLSFPPTSSPQPLRPRRRKNHQAKMIHRMTQEELSTDSWAWRKYGQKPIKGFPYPRNYYRCSTSKGCTARKQVERCPTDPNIFAVSYTGEHAHPRPTHRSSLAGSTRTKFSPAPSAMSNSSPPTTRGESEAEETNSDSAANIENGNEEDGNDDDEDEDVLIPNTLTADDGILFFRGFQDLSGGTSDSSGAGVADKSSCNLLSSPPWTPTSSTTTTTTNFAGGGGG